MAFTSAHKSLSAMNGKTECRVTVITRHSPLPGRVFGRFRWRNDSAETTSPAASRHGPEFTDCYCIFSVPIMFRTAFLIESAPSDAKTTQSTSSE